MANPRKADPGIGRAKTDAGPTGDKVAVYDPAAVPVEGDAEAAGTPTTAALAAASAARQAAMRATMAMAPFSAGDDPAGQGRGLWLGLGIVGLLVLGGILAGWASIAGI